MWMNDRSRSKFSLGSAHYAVAHPEEESRSMKPTRRLGTGAEVLSILWRMGEDGVSWALVNDRGKGS